MNGCWILSNVFPVFIDMIMWFFFFRLLILWNRLTLNIELVLHHWLHPWSLLRNILSFEFIIGKVSFFSGSFPDFFLVFAFRF